MTVDDERSPTARDRSAVRRFAARAHLRRFGFARHPNWWSLGVYAVLALWAGGSVWPGDPNRLPDCACKVNDFIQTAWFLRYVPFALGHNQNLFATHLQQWPAGVDLAQNTTIWLLGLVTAPLTILAGPIASLNLLRFLALVASSTSMYLVLRRLFASTSACFVGGLLYGFSPYVVAEDSLHLDLTFVPLPPIIFLAVFELVVRQRAAPWRWGLVLGLVAAAQFFISAEVLATTTLVIVVGLVVLGLVCVREVPKRLRHALSGGGIAAAILAAAVAYPVWMMEHGPDHYSGPAQGYDSVFNGDLLGAVVPTRFQRFAPTSWKTIGDALISGNIHENGAYLGVPLLLVAAYLVARYWRRLWPVYLAIVTLGVYVLELGWVLTIDGHRVSLPIEMPFAKLEHLPVLANVEPARLALYVAMLLAVLLAFGLEAYASDRRRRRADEPGSLASVPVRFGRLCGVAAGIVCALSLVPAFPFASRSIASRHEVSARELSVVAPGSVVLSYPFASPYSLEAMYWQTETDFRFTILGGYALVAGPGHGSELPHPLAPVEIQALFQQSSGKIVTNLPYLVADARTVTPHTALVLRLFLRRYDVGAIVVQRDVPRSGEIARLVRIALGPPTHAYADALFWTRVRATLRHPPALTRRI